MFKNLFRRRVSAAALIVPESETAAGWLAIQEAEAAKNPVHDSPLDQTMILHRGDLAALRERIAREVAGQPEVVAPVVDPRVAELEALLASKVVELEAVKALKPAKAKAPTTRKLATSKPVKLTALEFWALHGQAVENIRIAFGERWDLAPHGQTEIATLPTKFRSYVNAKGVKVVRSKLLRVPAAEFWADGALPSELATISDPVRVTECGVNPVPHDNDWHRAHGYEWFKGVGKAAVVKNGGTTIQPIMAGWFHSMEMPALMGRRTAALEAIKSVRASRKALKAMDAALQASPAPTEVAPASRKGRVKKAA